MPHSVTTARLWDMRNPRTDGPDRLHHITCRVNWQRFHLQDPRHAAIYFEELVAALEAYDMSLLAFVLMSNHHHFVVRSPAADRFRELTTRLSSCRHRRPYPAGHVNSTVLAQFMRRFHRVVSARLQRRMEVSGHFWGRRYHSRRIAGVADLASTIAYDHRNPVRPGMVVSPEHFPWSSAAAYESGLSHSRVPLALPERLPYGLTWSELRLYVLEMQGSNKLDALITAVRESDPESRHMYAARLRAALRRSELDLARLRQRCRTSAS